MAETWKPSIGLTVRARLPNHSKRKHRAIVADDDNDRFLLLWEDIVYQSSVIFTLPESWCSAGEIEPILDFEELKTPFDGDFAINKTRGDQLLSLGDAGTAIRYYQSALQSVPLQIGCTILVEEETKKKYSALRRAEVDCIDADGIDITIIPSGSEKTISADQVALVILESDEDYLQVRTLLNCARCCLQLAELSTAIKSYFMQRAIHFCSLCFVLLECAEEDGSHTRLPYLQTVFLLRSHAFAEKHQYDAALSDVSKLLQLNPNHEIGQRRVNLYNRKKEKMKQNEKKLVKAMCGYIKQATSGVSTPEEHPVPKDEPLQNGVKARVQSTHQSFLWILFLITVIFAWLLQKNL